MIGVRSFFRSMTGRIFAILTGGMAIAATIAALVTSYITDETFERQLIERTADQIETYAVLLDTIPSDMRATLVENSSMELVSPDTAGEARDAQIEQVLGKRGGVAAGAQVMYGSMNVCFGKTDEAPEEVRKLWQSEEVQRAIERTHRSRKPTPIRTRYIPPQCRIVELRFSDGESMKLSFGSRWIEREQSPLFEPAGLIMLGIAMAALAYVVARIATQPLIRLSDAAWELGQNLDRPPIPMRGPSEVQQAANAFNSMQKQLQDHIAERTRMLAAITHDLQTPLTRLRLRMERVEDEALRERLVADLQEMKALIDEGLELARSADTAEPRVRLDLDSLLESLVEDAADAGNDATFTGGCNAVLSVQPLAVRRLFSNLIENAIKYGGSANVFAERDGKAVIVRVRDRGPGVPQEMLDRVFDPFVRLEGSRSRETGGAGLGLTIARMLAHRNNATVTLRNHPEGGLESIVRWEG